MISPVTSQTAPTKLPSVLRSMGFESVASLTFTHRVDRLQDIISQLMETLRLNRVRQPLPPSGLAEITIHFPGPVTQKYTVINQPIPPAPIDAAPRLSTKDTLCVRAHMDTFFDVKFRNRISANSWYRFRVVDTTLLPWDPKSEKMSDVNPQILHKDHYFQQKCRPSFWTIDFETNEPRNSVGTTVLTGYCFEHNCVENNNQIKSQLVVQLAGYYISHKDWVLILSRLKDPVRDVKGSRIAATVFQGECYPRLLAVSAADIHEGNHKCGNRFEPQGPMVAGCTNPFCMI
jgi:hypothetical protein